MTDSTLVQEYARTHSPELLSELASRHSAWLYSAALRMVGDADLAEDVTQAVFVVLVQKAATLGEKPVNAWLFGVARFAAKHALRQQARRRKHERMAAMLVGATTETQSDDTWKAVAPLLEDLVGRLKRSDRQAVLLRFYQSKRMAEVGSALGVSEDAAKKRVAKAVKRLRELLAGRGVTATADVLGAALLGHATSAAPAKLAANCASAMLKKGTGAMSIAKGVISMMAMTKITVAAMALALTALVPAAIALALQAEKAPPPATQSNPPIAVDLQPDAADLYGQAAGAITIDSPAATVVAYPDYLPGSAEWCKVAAAAYATDGYVRELAHKARSVKTVNWPDLTDLGYINRLRNLANHLSDSAVFAETQGRHTEAVETIRDLMHMSDLLVNYADKKAVRVLVGVGIDALALDRLEVIATTIHITDKIGDTNDLQVADAKDLIAQLINQTSALEELNKALGPPGSPDLHVITTSRIVETVTRVNGEKTLAAISLAAHVFKFENGRWPNTLEEMIPSDLPHTMFDPWGVGGQTFGYVLIKGGLPDGSDRPLVYCRQNAQDGLCYQVNRPNYGFYFDDGTDRPAGQQRRYGQFRDVTEWEVRPDYKGPATLPLPPAAKTTGVNIRLRESNPLERITD